jgi:Kef-type K+ transport system membrane component KefB
MNPESVEGKLAITLLQWAIIILAARLGGWLAVRVGQPPAVGEIAAGLALGPSLFGWLAPGAFEALFATHDELLRFLGKLGLILFLFHVGLNFHVDHFVKRSRAVVAVAAAGMLVPFAIGLAVAPWLHAQFAPEQDLLGLAAFVAIAMSVSALPIMARMLMELGLERSVAGVTALSAAAIDDLVGWIGLAAVAALVVARLDGWPPAGQVLGLVVFALVLWKVVRPLHARVLDRFGLLSSTQWLFLVASLFLACLTTYHLGVFAIFGALMGLIAVNTGLELGVLSGDLFTMFVLMCLITTTMAAPLLRLFLGSEVARWQRVDGIDRSSRSA